MWVFRTLAILAVLLAPPLGSLGEEIVVEGTISISNCGMLPPVPVCVVRADDRNEYALIDVNADGAFDISDMTYCMSLFVMQCQSHVQVAGQLDTLVCDAIEGFGMQAIRDPEIVILSAPRVCGDVDGSGGINISDAIRILDHLFSATPASLCPGVSDVNGDGSLDISDAVYLLASLFRGGPAPQCP